MHVSDRAKEMKFSAIRQLLPYVEEAEKKGIHICKLNIGQPNIATPDSFFDALHNFKEKTVRYSDSKGILPLRKTFAEYYKKRGIPMGVEDMLITQGGSEAILFVMMSICNEGDEILLPEPFYSNYFNFCSFAGAKIVPIPTKIENNYHLPSKEVIEKLITPRTKAIMFSNPVNPTGTVFSPNEIKMLGEIAKEHDLYILADEVYREFIYDDVPYTSMTTFEEFKDNVILIDSISKHYSACGARIGAIATKNHELLQHLIKFCQARLCVSTIEQHAATNLINTPDNYVEEARNTYRRRRDLLYGYLKDIPGVGCRKPEGAFYLFIKLPVDNSEKFSKWLLTDYSYDNKTLFVAPGPGFYATPGKGDKEVRLSFCTGEEDIKDAMIILKNALEKYNSIAK